VPTYTLLVHDDRYSIPTLVFATGDENRVRDIAHLELDKSEHHLAVDVQDGVRDCFRVQRNGGGPVARSNPTLA
jgi:hypothetical protein